MFSKGDLSKICVGYQTLTPLDLKGGSDKLAYSSIKAVVSLDSQQLQLMQMRQKTIKLFKLCSSIIHLSAFDLMFQPEKNH